MNVWDERYRKHDTVYGVKPNAFWASQLALLAPGSVCLPCDGEGRNAVHAAEQGWSVYAFDASPEGVRKSAHLAQERGVSIEVEVADALQVDVTRTFDVVGLIFAHMPVELRRTVPPKGLVLGQTRRKVDRGRVSQDAIGAWIGRSQAFGHALRRGNICGGHREWVRRRQGVVECTL